MHNELLVLVSQISDRKLTFFTSSWLGPTSFLPISRLGIIQITTEGLVEISSAVLIKFFKNN